MADFINYIFIYNLYWFAIRMKSHNASTENPHSRLARIAFFLAHQKRIAESYDRFRWWTLPFSLSRKGVTIRHTERRRETGRWEKSVHLLWESRAVLCDRCFRRWPFSIFLPLRGESIAIFYIHHTCHFKVAINFGKLWHCKFLCNL